MVLGGFTLGSVALGGSLEVAVVGGVVVVTRKKGAANRPRTNVNLIGHDVVIYGGELSVIRERIKQSVPSWRLLFPASCEIHVTGNALSVDRRILFIDDDDDEQVLILVANYMDMLGDGS